MMLDVLLGLGALGLLLVPGALIASGCRVSFPILAGFIAGVVGLVAWVLLLGLLRVPLTRWSVGGGWLIISFGAFWFWTTRRGQQAPGPTVALRSDDTGWMLYLTLAPAFAVVVYRAVAQPLFGVDTVFRWNYLAEQMLVRRSLDFYPPITAADYAVYSWPDGIAPAVSSLYFWAYALVGAARPTLTAPTIVFQLLALFIATYALGQRFFSARAGAFACTILAGSPLVLWATSMGQETGLTAIATAAMLLYLPTTRSTANQPEAAFAGLSAGLCALAREYGLILPAMGLAFCLARRLGPRTTLIFFGSAIVAAFPWYTRNWITTGNPLFSLSLQGLFPVNPVHAWLNEAYLSQFGFAHIPTAAGQIILVNGLLGILGLSVGGVFIARSVPAIVLTAAAFAVLWFMSLGYTAAGFTYSLRVLNPALVLGAVAGGALLTRWVPGRRHLAGVALALALVAGDAALRALTLPTNVYRLPPGAWLTAGGAIHDYHSRPIYREIVRVAGDQRILTLGPNALLTTLGARTLPLWSPEVAYLFDQGVEPAATARRLLAADIGFVLLTTGSVNEQFLARSRFFRDPDETLVPFWSDADMVLLRIITAAKSTP